MHIPVLQCGVPETYYQARLPPGVLRIQPFTFAVCGYLHLKLRMFKPEFIFLSSNSLLMKDITQVYKLWESLSSTEYLQFYLLVCLLSERQSYREEEKHRERVFHPLVHPPNGHNGQGWARWKSGAQGFFRVSHRSFPRSISSELDWKWSNWILNQNPYEMRAMQAEA